MSHFYFAYGSNMNQQRMIDRGMRIQRALSGQLHGFSLVFNKRASDAPHRSYANICYAPGAVTEGVLYELTSPGELQRMDPFEGTPRLYSREIYSVATEEGFIPAWVYVANRAMIDDIASKPARWYLDHLLAGEPFLSAGLYGDAVGMVVCVDDSGPSSEWDPIV